MPFLGNSKTMFERITKSNFDDDDDENENDDYDDSDGNFDDNTNAITLNSIKNISSRIRSARLMSG